MEELLDKVLNSQFFFGINRWLIVWNNRMTVTCFNLQKLRCHLTEAAVVVMVDNLMSGCDDEGVLSAYIRVVLWADPCLQFRQIIFCVLS